MMKVRECPQCRRRFPWAHPCMAFMICNPRTPGGGCGYIGNWIMHGLPGEPEPPEDEQQHLAEEAARREFHSDD